MKKFLLSGSITALLLPGLALAAFNDTNLSTGVVLSVGGNTVTVSGTSAVIESMSVSATTITVALLPGSFIEVQSAGKTIATNAPANYIVTDTCSADTATLKLSSSISTGSMTITPSGSACSGNASGNSTTVVSTGSGSGSSGGGGGGGGGGGYTPPVATTPATPATPATNNANLTSEQRSALIVTLTAQIQTLLAQIAVLQGKSSSSASFSRDLETGSTGDDVRALQAYLNSHGFAVASSGAGSPGNETNRFGGLTRAALIKFQKAKGITPPAGYFGPKTRAYISAHP